MVLTAGVKRYFTNTAWLLLQSGVSLALGFLVGIFVARHLGPERLGTLSYAASFAALFSAIAGLGLRKIVTREIVDEPEQEHRILGTALVLHLFGAAAMVFAIALTATLVGNPPATVGLILLAAGGPILSVLSVAQLYFHARVLARYAALAQIGAAVAIAAIKGAMILAEAPLVAFVAAIPLEAALLMAGLFVAYRSQGLSPSNWRFDPVRARRMIADGWPLIFAGLSVAIYMRIDQVMIKHMLGAAPVGHYAIAVNLVAAWYFLPTALSTSLFPAIVEARRLDPEAYQRRLQMFFNLMAAVGLAAAVLTALVARPLITIVYGQPFAPAVPALQIYAWSLIATILGVASGQYLVAENYTRIALARTTFGMVCNVVLNLWLIPRHGIEGAAVATVVSYTVATFLIVMIPKVRRQGWMLLLALLSVGLYRPRAARPPSDES